MAVPILRLNIDDNPRIIVKQDTTPITYTGWTVNLVGSGGTIVTGSGANWTIYSSVPSGNTWGSLSGSISNQTDLWNILTGQTADILANTQCCTGNTAAIDYHYSQFTGFTDYFATLIIPAITGNTQDISDLSGAFQNHTGNTLIHFEKTDISYNDLQDLPTLFSGDYDDLTNKPDLSIYLTGYTVTADDVTGITASLYAPIIHTHPYSGLTGLPTLFSGDYDDLTNKPDLSVYQPVSGMSIYLTGVTWNDVTNKPDLTLQADFTGHTSDLTIHYPQSGISITESQISDFGDYALESDFTGHTSDLTIHFVQSGISITESQISDLQAYTLTGTTQALSDAFDTYTGTTAPASFLPITGLTGYWNSGQTVDYVTGYTPTLEWGNITGSISGQTDLWSYLSGGTGGGTWGTITGDITGQTDLVIYVNTAISAATSGMTTSLSGLTDTTITTPADNDILKYTGGTWINEAALNLFEYVDDLYMLRRSGDTVVGIPYSVMTGATGAQGIQGESGLTPTLVFTGVSIINYSADYTSTGVTYTVGVQAQSGITPTLVFTGASVVNYSQVGTTYTLEISGQTGAQGIQGAPGSGATILISSGNTICTYISGDTTGNTWSVYSPPFPLGMTGITVTTGVTWTVPANVNRIWVKLWGAGGGGGTAASNNSRGGGGGGAYSESIISVSSGQTFYAIVGGGGTAGNNGGDTSFSGSTIISAGGGVGTTTATGGNGGSTSGSGMIKIAGQKGGNSIGAYDGGHAGGGGGSPFGGQGGQGIGGANAGTAGANGNAGCFPAGGGSGAAELTGTGGSGADGFILIYW